MEKYAMIFAAGRGTRLAPLTDHTPKALVKLDDKPILWHVLHKLQQAGFNHVVINVHHLAQQIIDYIQSECTGFGISIAISHEKEFLADTGGGLKLARNFFTTAQHILLHNVDIIATFDLNQLWQHHLNSNALATLAVSKRPSARQLLFDNQNRLCGWMNCQTQETIGDISKANQQFAFSGIHVVSTEVFHLMPDEPIFSMTQLYVQLCNNHYITYFEHDPNEWMDIGTPEQLQKAQQTFRKHHDPNTIS